MEAGRELDALIDLEVFGLYESKFVGEVRLSGDGENWCTLDGKRLRVADKNGHLPHYSTLIQDAWLVVERLAKRGGANVHLHENGMTQVWIGGKITASADTAPLAVCLAALKAVEVT